MAQQSKIENNISVLESMVLESWTDAFNIISPEKKDYGKIWGLIKETGRMFKGAKFDNKQVREDLWNRLQVVVDRMKQEREEHTERMANKKASSEGHLQTIKNMLPMTREGEGFADVAIALATAGGSVAIKLTADAIFGEEDEELNRLHRAGDAIKSAGQYLSEHKEEMFGNDKKTAFERIQWAREQLNKEWDDYKGRKHQAKQERQRQWETKNEERRAKHNAWRERTNEFISKQRSWVSKMEGVIAAKETNISKLYDDIRDSNNSGFISRAEGWIENDRDAISEIQLKIDDAEERIRDAESKLQNSE